MRMLLLVGWLMLPLGVGIWHYGPGQERVRLDDTAGLLAEAERHAAAGEWAEAAEKYEYFFDHVLEERQAQYAGGFQLFFVWLSRVVPAFG